jgi:hypothetical protein
MSAVANINPIHGRIAVYDGNGYKISNLTINNNNLSNVGLFGTLTGKAVRTTLENVNITSTRNNTNVGGIAGSVIQTGVIEYCRVTGSITHTGDTARVGGIAGHSIHGLIRYCFNESTVTTSTNSAHTNLGGIVGLNGSGKVSNSINTGGLVLLGSGSAETYLGGIVGSNSSVGVIEYCLNVGTITGPGTIGGVAGVAHHTATQTNNYFLNSVTTHGVGMPAGSANAAPLTNEELQDSANFMGWDFDDIWSINAGINNGYPYLETLVPGLINVDVLAGSNEGEIRIAVGDNIGSNSLLLKFLDSNTSAFARDGEGKPTIDVIPYTSGASIAFDRTVHKYVGIYVIDGSDKIIKFRQVIPTVRSSMAGNGNAASPFLVSNATDLQNISVNPGSHYRMINNIDLNGVAFTPIGDEAGYFYGTFDGGNYKITNLSLISDAYDHLGFFQNNVYGTIKNLIMENITIDNTKSSGMAWATGGIAGMSLYGNIYNCHIIGDSSIRGYFAVGGIAGDATGYIEKCSNSAEISVNPDSLGYAAVGGIAGGLYGAVVNGTRILNCYNTGNIIGNGSTAVNDNVAAGGIAGEIYSVVSSGITVAYTYTTGAVTASNSNYVGSVFGLYYVQDPVFSNIFYLAGTAAASIGEAFVPAPLEDIVSKTDEELRNIQTFAGWDTDIWVFASGSLPKLKSQQLDCAVTPPPVDPGPAPTPAPAPAPAPMPAPGIPIMVNGQTQQQAAIASTQNQDGRTVTTVTLDTQKIIALVNAASTGSTVTVPVNNAAADAVVGQLSGDLVKAMENREAVIEIKTNNASYTLPARQINIDAVLAQLGQDVKLSDVRLNIEIANATGEMARIVEDSAVKGSFAIVVPPLSFTVKATYGDKTLNISRFDSYVARTVAIPEGVDPSKITTGIVVEPDGTVRHVPTQIIVIDGKYYAKINSLTNSTYSVIWNPVEFSDVASHWAKEAVNDMGSRLVISGIGNNMFVPDRDITRAEFAAIMVRALGLKAGIGGNPFTDVSSTAWYCDSIKTAVEYKLISGYGDGRFGPSDKLTREQAMAIISRAMNITGLKAELAGGEAEKLLAGFTDAAKAADYARNSIAACLKAGIVSGRGGRLIAPKDNITRAEVAAIVQRLLRKSGLI